MQLTNLVEPQYATSTVGVDVHPPRPAKVKSKIRWKWKLQPNFFRRLNKKQCYVCEVVLISGGNIPKSSFLDYCYICTTCQTTRERKKRNRLREENKLVLKNSMGSIWKNVIIRKSNKELGFSEASTEGHDGVSKTAKKIVDKWLTKTERRLLKDPLLTREVHLKY